MAYDPRVEKLTRQNKELEDRTKSLETRVSEAERKLTYLYRAVVDKVTPRE